MLAINAVIISCFGCLCVRFALCVLLDNVIFAPMSLVYYIRVHAVVWKSFAASQQCTFWQQILIALLDSIAEEPFYTRRNIVWCIIIFPKKCIQISCKHGPGLLVSPEYIQFSSITLRFTNSVILPVQWWP